MKIVHGFVKDGSWDGEMPEQPRPFSVSVEAEVTTSMRYEYRVGWFEDQYVYQNTR